jgi:hypothetical protein
MGEVPSQLSKATPPTMSNTTLTTIEQPSPAATPAAPNPARSSGEGRLVTVHPPDLALDCEGYHNLEMLNNAIRHVETGITAQLHNPPFQAIFFGSTRANDGKT